MKRAILTGLVAISLISSTLGADDAPSITAVKATRKLIADHRPDNQLTVFFVQPGKLSPTDVQNKDSWSVTAFYPDPPNSSTTPKAVRMSVDHIVILGSLAGSGMVTLFLSNNLQPQFDHVVAQYTAAVGSSTGAMGQPSPPPPLASAADSKDNADIYIDGSITPAVGSGPTYSTDSSVAFKLTGNQVQWFAIAGSINTDNRKVADPDSFRWRTNYYRVEAFAGRVNADLGGGMEFDRNGKALNLLASPKLILPIVRNWPRHITVEKPLQGTFELDLYGGVETGGNLKGTYRFSTVSLPGTKRIFRGVPGATLYLNFYHPFGFKEISFTSDYQVRLLATREIFLETRLGTADPVPLMRQQPRHHVENDLVFKITDYLGISVKHEYGALPPAFTFVQHKAVIGLVLQLRQNRTLRLK